MAAGGRPRRNASRGRDALTPSELRVAELAAAGRTNRQIAQSLFVTQRTVENHLTSAYAKLGITARPELAAVLAPARTFASTANSSDQPVNSCGMPSGAQHQPRHRLTPARDQSQPQHDSARPSSMLRMLLAPACTAHHGSHPTVFQTLSRRASAITAVPTAAVHLEHDHGNSD